MPRPKEYANNAERQAAYRARHRDRQPPRQAWVAALARTLQYELRETVRQGCCPWPAHLLAAREDETLQNLIHYLRACHAEESDH